MMPNHLTARLSGQRILVTGASGFLGSHLCRRLRQEGAEIHATSRSRHNDVDGTHWSLSDLTDVASVRRIFMESRPEVIVHLSGLVTAASGVELVLPTLHSLLVSTVNVLTVAAEIGCRRVVLAASLTEPIPDHKEVTPSSPYAAAKWAGSAYGRMFCQLYDLPVVIVRPFMTYGPGQDIRKLIPYVTLSLLRGKTPKLSSGKWEADWIYVDDLTNGLLAAAQLEAIPDSTIDLGSGTLTSIRTIVQHLVELTESRTAPVFGALADRPFEQVRAADLSYADKVLGWRPSVPLLDGLERTVDWCRRVIKDEIA